MMISHTKQDHFAAKKERKLPGIWMMQGDWLFMRFCFAKVHYRQIISMRFTRDSLPVCLSESFDSEIIEVE